jgi:hypothetical protein
MSRRRFYVLLGGLSPQAMFRRVAGDEVSIIDDDEQIRAALHS